MSQMPPQAALSKCPSCAEPLESGDRFCGACGHDLSVAAVPQNDTPTLTMSGGAVPRPAAPADDPQGPGLPPYVARPDASGAEAPAPAHPLEPAQASSGVRFDRHAEPDEYPLQAPDPRVAAEAVAEEGATVCVACRAGRVDSDGYCENCGHAQPRERDHMEQEDGPVAAVSDRGLRHHRNEDAFAVGRAALPDGSPAVVAVVCDGVSSATRPDEASLPPAPRGRAFREGGAPRRPRPPPAPATRAPHPPPATPASSTSTSA
ncbi:zinc-ribbon domain-containing protein, partial [Streptomyces anandii]